MSLLAALFDAARRLRARREPLPPWARIIAAKAGLWDER
jgi:hypothetical protein